MRASDMTHASFRSALFGCLGVAGSALSHGHREWQVFSSRLARGLPLWPCLVLAVLFGLRSPLASAQQKTLPLAKYGGSPHSVAFSPDGKMLAGGALRIWKVWDLSGNELAAVEDRKEEMIKSLAFSPDGKTLITCGRNIRLWNTQKWKQSAFIETTDVTILPMTVAYSPAGNVFASGHRDGRIILWDPSSAKEVATLTGHDERVQGLSFSRDGKLLASASNDGTVRLWDVAVRKEKAVIQAGDALSCVAIAPVGKIVAAGSRASFVKMWDVETLKTKGELTPLLMNSVECISFSPDGKLLAAGIYSHKIPIWNTATLKTTRELQSGTTRCLAFSPDGKFLATGGATNGVELWDLNAD
jgi:WD40 repeat protein